MPILVRHPQHLRDYLERKLGGDVGYEIAIAPFNRRLENFNHHLPDMRAERVDHARRESSIYQRAVARVIGRVHREHHAALRRQVSRSVGILQRNHAAARLLGGIGDAVAAHFDHVVVTRNHPESGTARFMMMEDWRVVPQPGEPFVGNALFKNERVEQIDLASVHSCASEPK